MTQQLDVCCQADVNLVESITDTVIKLSFATTSEDIADLVKSAARSIAGAEGAAFIFSDGSDCFYADEDAISPLWKGKRFPKESCISGYCMTQKKQEAIVDIYLDERIPHDLYRPTFVKSLLMTPVRKEAPIAAIGVYWAHNHQVSDEQSAMIQALADVTAIAVQNIEQKQNLEALVNKRTKELATSRDELKQLAYNVSHELQSPLRNMSSSLRQLSSRYKDRLDKDADTFISDALSSGTQVDRMLDALWMYARIEQDTMPPSSILSEDCLNRALTRLSDLITSTRTQVTHSSLPRVRANKAQLDYVFQELIENAIKFNLTDPAIHINVQKQDDKWVFSLNDNGVGFDMVEGNLIFGMFQQLDKTKPGTGMGLTVCRRIIESCGGQMWAQSNKNNGSTFYFSLQA